MKSWKTTVTGILAIVMAGSQAATGIITGTDFDLNTTLAAIIAGVGLLTAKDHKKEDD